MNTIIVITATVTVLSCLLFVSVMGYIWLVARKSLSLWRKKSSRPNTVSVHTYKPNNSVIPPRGWLVLKEGCSLASKYNCPLILSVGKTVSGETRMESEIYRDGACSRFGTSGVSIITGGNPGVRETLGEVSETLVICHRFDSKEHIAIGLTPHMARIRLLWHRVHPENQNPHITFLPVSGPWKYWLWETAMLCLYAVAPPGSKLQGLLLNIVGRKG
jgi:hypothetical protein